MKNIAKRFVSIVAVFLLVFISTNMNELVYSADFTFKNGDKISAELVREDEEYFYVKSANFGEVQLKKSNVLNSITEKEIQEKAAKEAKGIEWKRNVEVGLNVSDGNTEKASFLTSAFVNRKTDRDEYTFKTKFNFASTNDKTDTRKFNASGRYAFSFGEERKWFNSYKIEVDHDEFSNIDYRISPSVGIGYWFSDTKEWKAMVELGLGGEYTRYMNGLYSDTDVVPSPHVYLEKLLFGKSVLSEDFYFYPTLEDSADYRFLSVTKLSNPITDNLSLNVTLDNEYDSSPTGGAEKHDVRLSTSLGYTF